MAGAVAGLGLAEAGATAEAVTAFTLVATGVAVLYCLGRAVVDFRQRRFGWAAAGLICAILLLSIPIETHAVKYDILPPSGG